MTELPIAEAKVPVGLAAALAEVGVPVGDVLACAELPAGLLDEPVVRLPVPRYFALWHAVRVVADDPGVGIALARRVRADHTEPLFLALLSARDLAGAIEAAARYKRVLSPDDFVATRRRREVTLTSRWPAPFGDPPQVLIDAELAFVVEMGRRATRDDALAPRRLTLRASKLERGAPHEAFFGCPVELGAGTDTLAFAGDEAERPFATHNPQLLAALEPYLAVRTPAADPTVEQVRTAIAQGLRGARPTITTVSRDVAMSARSLQRLLREHRTSFRELSDEVRNDQARHYLRTTGFSDPEIAYLIGFEEPTSFYRAFRAWNGVTPGEYRRGSG